MVSRYILSSSTLLLLPTQEARHSETVVPHRVRRRARLGQRTQPIARTRMNRPLRLIEHHTGIDTGQGRHPAEREHPEVTHARTVATVTDTPRRVSTQGRSPPDTDNQVRPSMTTDNQRNQHGTSPTAPRQHGRHRGGRRRHWRRIEEIATSDKRRYPARGLPRELRAPRALTLARSPSQSQRERPKPAGPAPGQPRRSALATFLSEHCLSH